MGMCITLGKSVRALGHINFKANYFNIHSITDGYTLPFIVQYIGFYALPVLELRCFDLVFLLVHSHVTHYTCVFI